VHQLVIKNFDNSRMHGTNVKKKVMHICIKNGTLVLAVLNEYITAAHLHRGSGQDVT